MRASLNFLHHQNTDWLRELKFYKEELFILNKRLEEIASKNTGKDVLAQVEHFQNKFILLREQLDTLKHDVGIREKNVEQVAMERPNHIDERLSVIRGTIHTQIKDFSQSIADTRLEFNTFAAKNL